MNFKGNALLLATALMLVPSSGYADDAVIADGKKVTINYVVTSEGNVVDSSEQSGPLSYDQGQATVLPPKLQAELAGLKVGEHKSITLQPEDAYGPIYQEAIVEVPKTSLPEGDVQIGTVLSTTDENGTVLTAMVKEVRDQTALVDFNHPLAGKVLVFEIDIVEIV